MVSFMLLLRQLFCLFILLQSFWIPISAEGSHATDTAGLRTPQHPLSNTNLGDGFSVNTSHSLNSTDRPLFINLGQGTTGTHGIHEAMCKNKLRACHFYLYCPGHKLTLVREHRDLIELQLAAHLCIDSAASLGKLRDRFRNRKLDCDAVAWQKRYTEAVHQLVQVCISNVVDPNVMSNST